MNLTMKKLGILILGVCIANTIAISAALATGVGYVQPTLSQNAFLDKISGLDYSYPINIARSNNGQPLDVALFKFNTSGVDLTALTSLKLTIYGYPDRFNDSASSELVSYGVSDDWSSFTTQNINSQHQATLASNQVSAVAGKTFNQYTFDLLNSTNLPYLTSAISDGNLSFAIQEVVNDGTIRTDIYSANSGVEAKYMPQLVATYKEVPPTTPEPSSLILGMMGLIGGAFGVRRKK